MPTFRIDKENIVIPEEEGAVKFARQYTAAMKGDHRDGGPRDIDERNREKFHALYDDEITRSGFAGSGTVKYTNKKTGEAFVVDKTPNGKGFHGTDHMVTVASDSVEEGKATVSAAAKRADKKRQTAIRKAKAYMKRMNVSADKAAKEYDVRASDLTEASELKSYKVTYKTKRGETTVKVKARDENEAKARVRGRPNYQGNAVATLNETKSKKITEGVLDDMDDDGFMAKRQLYDLAKYAVELHRMIQDTDNLEPWIQAKITKASDYIDTVKHYLEYSDIRDAEDMADAVGMDDIGDVNSALDTMGPEEPVEAVTEYEEEVRTLDGHDILRMAQTRGIISQDQYYAPTVELLDAAEWVAEGVGEVDEIGSSDVSIWMREFVANAKASGIDLDGERAHVYESKLEAQKIYDRMFENLRKK